MSTVPLRAEPRADDLPFPLTLTGLRTRAIARLDPLTAQYLESGAGDQATVVANTGDFAKFVLEPHVLRDVADVSTETALFGVDYDLPVLVAPTGSHGLFNAGAEAATARGAVAAGAGMVLSAYSNTGIEEVGMRDGLWMQVNPPPSRSYLDALSDRAAAAGAQALVVTVDTPVVGAREAQRWDGLSLPDGLSYPMLDGLELRSESAGGIYRTGLDPTFDARALERVVARSPIPVVVKGVLRGDDARVAADAGAAAVVVSNHGGRNLDSGLSPVVALPGVAAAVGAAIPVLLDGGIRRGTDVLKAIALGAWGVLVGRPVLWGLTVGGERGVAAVLDLLGRELAMAMALCGVRRIGDIGPHLVASDDERRR